MKPVMQQIEELEERVIKVEGNLRKLLLGLPVCKVSIEGKCPLYCVDESCVALEKVRLRHE